MNKFIGRKQELQQLGGLLQKTSASLVVVKGRRRVGKSRLLEEFCQPIKTYSFSGVPPTPKTTMQDQLHEFGWQLGKALNEPPFTDNNWNDLFLRLANRTKKGRVIIVFDEISWLGSCDDNFLGKLKNAWDLEFKKNPQLILILCGSVSTWIEDNILSSTGFLGRVSLDMTIEELPLYDCNEFWQQAKNNIAAYEKLKILAVTGGIPKYLEEIRPQLSAENNIKNLCFDRTGLLFNDFEHIFTNIFSKRSDLYRSIIECLVNGPCEAKKIYAKLSIQKSGVINSYLGELITSGFIRRDYTWLIATGKVAKFSRYRISDNYLAFYLKYILPNKEKIERNAFANQSLALLPGWDTIMGLQFENLVLRNRSTILKILNIMPNDVVYDNPFFQSKTKKRSGCQIDYLIQTRFNTLYVCEIKFSKYPIKEEIMSEVQEKITKLQAPKYFSYRPVLIHVNGVCDELADKGYFSGIIDFGQLLIDT